MPRPPRIVEAALAAGGVAELLAALTPAQRELLKYEWAWWLRPLEQTGTREFRGQGVPPGEWMIWLLLCGAGFGKTMVGAQWAIEKARRFPGCRIGLIGATMKDAREVMWEGPNSGIKACCPPWWQPHFNVVDQAIEFPNGSVAPLYSAEVPESLRGPQHHFVWWDEPAKCRLIQDVYDLMFHRLRLGEHPQAVLTTTPKRLKFLHRLVQDPATVVTRGKTTDNAANLPKWWLEKMLTDYAGTRLGRQELEGELFDENPGALWQEAWIRNARLVPPTDVLKDTKQRVARTLAWLEQMLGEKLRRVVTGVDPSTTSKVESDECGIVVAALGRAPKRDDPREHAYVLEDGTEKLSPDMWARKVVRLHQEWGGDAVVAETTLGGETIPSLIRFVDSRVKVIERGGNRGKVTRAEPVAALYEQGRVHHVGSFDSLEDQYCEYTLDTKKSPNNMDAAVHAVGELMIREREQPLIFR